MPLIRASIRFQILSQQEQLSGRPGFTLHKTFCSVCLKSVGEKNSEREGGRERERKGERTKEREKTQASAACVTASSNVSPANADNIYTSISKSR